MKIIVFIFILTLIIIIFILSLQKNKVDNFNNAKFIKSFKDKNIIICGNSPNFPESFSKTKSIPNQFIIRFNTVLNFIDLNDKTDVLFVSKELLEKNTIDEFSNWKQKCKRCKVYFINETFYNNKLLDNINKSYPLNFTSGFTTITYLLNYTNKITLVGFDLPDNYNSKTNWFRDNPTYKGHDIYKEKELLNELIYKYKLNKI